MHVFNDSYALHKDIGKWKLNLDIAIDNKNDTMKAFW